MRGVGAVRIMEVLVTVVVGRFIVGMGGRLDVDVSMNKLLLLSILLLSCAHKPRFEYDSNYSIWMNRHVDELLTQPVYATMPMKLRETDSGIKVYSFKNSGGFSSKGSCVGNQWSADCVSSRSEVACSHVFTVGADKRISNYQRVGRCGPEELNMRPFKDGEPVLTDDEIKRLDSRDIASFDDTPQKDCGVIGKIIGCK
jgi:hypothetical protein